jgi:Zn-dependent protease with chaperone function
MSALTALAVIVERPNALDFEVNAIPLHRLLTSPALSLVDPAREQAALHFEQSRIPVWIAMVALQIVVLAWFWSSGRSAQLRGWLRGRVRAEFAVRFSYGAVLAVIDRAAALLPQVIEYRLTRIMGLTDALLRSWLAEWVLQTLLIMLAAGLIAAFVLWLADKTHQWYLYTIAALMGGILAISYLTPYWIAGPGPAQAHAHDLVRLQQRFERQTQIQVPLVVQHEAGRDRTGVAYVSGWGGSQKIVFSDTEVDGSTPGELRYLLARAYAWIEANSGLHLALVQGAFAVIGAALGVFLSDRVGFRRDDDPVSRLALLGALLGCVYVVGLPIYNAYSRNLEARTDAAAIAFTGDRADAIRHEVRTIDQELLPVCPGAFALWYLTADPAPGDQIAWLQGSRSPSCRGDGP